MLHGAVIEQGDVMVRADPVTLTVIAVIAVAAVAAYYLLQPGKQGQNPLDDSKSEPSVRGTLASFLLGRMRIGPVIGYVGARRITKEDSEGGGGGKGGGGDTPKTTIYNEMGMHIISTGLGTTIRGIYQAGKNILATPISSATTPSGSTVSLGKEGSFRVYWGEASQPVDTALASKTGLSSTFPHIFYLVWNTKRLGQQALWPQIEYDVEVTHPADLTLPTDGEYLKGQAGSDSFTATVQDPSTLDTSGYSSILSVADETIFAVKTTDIAAEDLRVGSDLTQSPIGYDGEVVNVLYNSTDYIIMLNRSFSSSAYGNPYTFTTSRVEYSGVNPSSALYQMFFSEFPHGLGWDRSLFELSDFDTLADLFKNTELSPCTILLRSGKSYRDAVASLMQDFGLFFWMDTTTAKLRINAIRSGDTPVTISEDEYINNELARAFGYAVLNPDKVIYSFKDSARKFADSTILITNDAGAKYSDNPNAKKVALNTITDFDTASEVSSRRDQENSINEVLTLDLSSAHIDMAVGQLLELESLAGAYRLVSKNIDPDSARITASLMLDAYSITNNYRIIQGSGANPISRIDPSPDLHVGLLETNRFLAKDLNGFYATRIRFNDYIITADLFTSADDVSYAFLDTLFYGTGGVLQAELPETTTLVDDGILIDIEGPDITDVRDLSASEELWRGGSQLAIIGTEICFLQGIDVGTGELLGLIRARYGTRMQIHPIGTPVFILNGDTLDLFSRTFLVPEADLYIKSLPYTSSGQLPPDETTAESITYKGGGFRPLPCENLGTEDSTDSYDTGEDIDIRWSYKNASDAGAAGIGLSGEASAPVPPEGTFLLQILNGTTVVRTVEQSGTAYTYTNANLVSDFSGEPASFNLKVFEVLNGLTSEEETATITKV